MFGSLILIQTSTKRRTETQEQTFYTSSSMLAISGKKMKKKVSDAIISWKLKQELDGCEKKICLLFLPAAFTPDIKSGAFFKTSCISLFYPRLLT